MSTPHLDPTSATLIAVLMRAIRETPGATARLGKIFSHHPNATQLLASLQAAEPSGTTVAAPQSTTEPAPSVTEISDAWQRHIHTTMPPMDAAGVSWWQFSAGYRAGRCHATRPQATHPSNLDLAHEIWAMAQGPQPMSDAIDAIAQTLSAAKP